MKNSCGGVITLCRDGFMTYIHINEPGVKDTWRHGEGAAHYQDKPVADPGFPWAGDKKLFFARTLPQTAWKWKKLGGGDRLKTSQNLFPLSRGNFRRSTTMKCLNRCALIGFPQYRPICGLIHFNRLCRQIDCNLNLMTTRRIQIISKDRKLFSFSGFNPLKVCRN